ncbi:MAG: Calx-beta domain-containing protein [Planctomycetota bacterium]
MSRKLACLGPLVIQVALAGGTSAADLIVPSGTTVTKNTIESFGQFMVAGRLTVEDGASLTFTSESHIDGAETGGIRPEIVMNGGSLSLANRMNMGTDKTANGGNYAYLTMNGGTFTVTGTFKFPDDAGGVHRMWINGGILSSADIELRGDRDAIIYVGGGILRLTNGDFTTNPDVYYNPLSWISQGWLRPADGYDDLNVEYVAAGNYTEITGISAHPRVQFDTAASENLETVSPVSIPVNVTNPEPAVTYTVQYLVGGGTATPGDDYTVPGNGTLIFNPGDVSKTIDVSIVNDGLDEEDETITMVLLSVTGGSAILGTITEHTYTIVDPRPAVEFVASSSSDAEDVTLVNIPVSLSVPVGEVVTVNYAATGGTAASGVDYTLSGDGTLTFDPYETAGTITINVADDTIREAGGETIVLTLSNPSPSVKLGGNSQHTHVIIDNDDGVLFDGLTWFYSRHPTPLYVNELGQLRWTPEKGEQLITRLPEQRLSQVGDKIELTYWWMTDGAHNCADCFDCELYCLDDDITCIAGTSDMRVGLFEADGEYITADGYAVTGSPVFGGYKGYAWRFGPNMIAGPTRWVDCTNEVHKTGNFQKKPASLDNLMYTNDGLEAYIPGFELPPGEWSLFKISLERISSSSVKSSITLNGRTYTWTDTSSSEQPSKIDVLAIHMRNGRPYTILSLEPVCKPPVSDLSGDKQVNMADVDMLGGNWLASNFSQEPAGQLVAWWEFDEGEGTIAYDSAGIADAGLIGNPSWVAGRVGSHALDFDGAGDFVIAADLDGSLDIEDEITVAAWVWLNNLSGYQFIANKQPSGGAGVNYPGNYGFRIRSSDGYLELTHQTSLWEEYSDYTSTSGVLPGGWYHVAATLVEGKDVRFYIDGYPAGTSLQTGTFGIVNDQPVRIGTRKDLLSWFDGKIDDLRLYNYALYPEEVRRVYDGLGLEQRFKCLSNPVGDLNDDCRVNFGDFGVLASQWLQGCP